MTRRRLLWLCFIAAVVIAAGFSARVFTTWADGDGLTLRPTAQWYVDEVSAATGPAARAGIRKGDLIDARSLPISAGGGTRNSARHVTVLRDGRAIDVTIEPQRTPLQWHALIRWVAEIWSVLFAALIAWRGQKWTGSAPLALILALSALGDFLNRVVFPVPSVTFASHMIGLVIFGPLCFALLAWYFSSFARPRSTPRTFWMLVAYAASCVSAASIGVWYYLAATAWSSSASHERGLQIFEVFLTSPILPCLFCGVLAVRATNRSEAQRIGWVVASYGIFWIFWLLAGPLGSLWGSYSQVAWGIEDAAHLLVPLGLTYAALQRRLFDIGFVINRAAVFGASSTIVIGTFVLFEWAVGKWFEGVSHATNITLNVAMALLLGFSLRFLHRRVDTIVDNLFFRKRHENERTLRRFAREASLITDRDVLVGRTIDEVLKNTEATSARVLFAADMDLNDRAVLALRTWHEPVELPRYHTALSGEYAFPMSAHGEFIGAIVCGTKRNEESYAPDEVDALKHVADGVGAALWALDATGRRGDVSLEILAELRALRVALQRDAARAPQNS